MASKKKEKLSSFVGTLTTLADSTSGYVFTYLGQEYFCAVYADSLPHHVNFQVTDTGRLTCDLITLKADEYFHVWLHPESKFGPVFDVTATPIDDFTAAVGQVRFTVRYPLFEGFEKDKDRVTMRYYPTTDQWMFGVHEVTTTSCADLDPVDPQFDDMRGTYMGAVVGSRLMFSDQRDTAIYIGNVPNNVTWTSGARFPVLVWDGYAYGLGMSDFDDKPVQAMPFALWDKKVYNEHHDMLDAVGEAIRRQSPHALELLYIYLRDVKASGVEAIDLNKLRMEKDDFPLRKVLSMPVATGIYFAEYHTHAGCMVVRISGLPYTMYGEGVTDEPMPVIVRDGKFFDSEGNPVSATLALKYL